MAAFTRKSIMESFVRLLDEKPLGKISVKDIVEDCGINRNTFYYRFADIPSLVEAQFTRLYGLRRGMTEEMIDRACGAQEAKA